MPRSRRSRRYPSTASGMPPMPVCSVAPSGIREATFAGDAPLQRRWAVRPEVRAAAADVSTIAVDFADVQERIAERARHLVVHFGDHVPGAARRGQRAVDASAEAQVAVLVGRRGLDEGHVDRHLARGEQPFDFAEEDRRVVGAALLDGLAHVGAEEQSVVAEMAFVLGPDIGRVPNVSMCTISTSCSSGARFSRASTSG